MLKTRLPFCLIVICTAFAALAPSATAATVSLERVEYEEDDDVGGGTFAYGNVVITAAAGETNTMEISYTPDSTDTVLVRDATAPLVAGARCEQVDSNTVRCQDATARSIESAVANLGDMDDVASYNDDERLLYVRLNGGPGDDRLSGSWTELYGETGNDTLTGTDQSERLDGGPGDDLLEGLGDYDGLKGGTGNDVLRGGGGGDRLEGGGWANEPGSAGNDLLDGGPDFDTLNDEDYVGQDPAVGPDILIGGEGIDHVYSYGGSRAPVYVDLTKTTGQGRAGENDTLDGIENVQGGDAGDTLIGNDAPNYLDGEAGRDLVRGGAGDDRIYSWVNPTQAPNKSASRYGPDRIFGEDGNDMIETLPTLESRISCGDGTENVVLMSFASDKAHSSLGPLVSQSCESISMSYKQSVRNLSLDPLPTRITRDRLFFKFTTFRCCDQVMQLKRVTRAAPILAEARLRRKTLRLKVGRRVIRASKAKRVTLRGKITKVGINRFVWRFQLGKGAF